jgi:RimJ/RimL family protein N-acetyltransferase
MSAFVPELVPPAVESAAGVHRLRKRSLRHHSARLRLRPLSQGDAADLWEATRDPAFNAQLTWAQPQVQSEVAARVQDMCAQLDRGEACWLSAIEIASGRWVGVYRIEPDASGPAPGWFELGMWVHPAFWGAGFAAELHALGTLLAFVETEAPGLSAGSAVDNPKGWRTLERMGFLRQGEYLASAECGRPIPAYAYRLHRDDWERSTAPPAAA